MCRKSALDLKGLFIRIFTGRWLLRPCSQDYMDTKKNPAYPSGPQAEP